MRSFINLSNGLNFNKIFDNVVEIPVQVNKVVFGLSMKKLVGDNIDWKSTDFS